MRSYIKLVNFEWNRFAKMYIMLLAVIFIIQLATTLIKANLYMKRAIELTQKGMGQTEFIDMYSTFGLIDVTDSIGFLGSIALGVISLLFYVFFIWYRDWFARTTFVYRLLTLPTSRMNVYFAKITTIMLTVFGLISLQLAIMKVLEFIIKWIVPISFRDSLSVSQAIYSSYFLDMFYPKGMMEFFITYGLGLTFVIVIFTVILLERSYRWKGLAAGVLYFAISFFILFIPEIGQWILDFYLYPAEYFAVELLLVILIAFGSLWIGRFLLKNKVSV